MTMSSAHTGMPAHLSAEAVTLLRSMLLCQIAEHADKAAGTFATVNDALMGRISELTGRSSNQKSGSRS